MRFIIQRVSNASVQVEQETVGEIEEGLLVFVGIHPMDNREIADKMIQKMVQLRIFADENDKINLSVQDKGGSILMISQFTLYADCKKGNRPSFTEAAGPDLAKELYEYTLTQTNRYVDNVQKGIFGGDMKVSLLNDGPFTVVLDSDNIVRQKNDR